MTEIMENPVFWVVVSFATFVALAVYKKLPSALLAALDSRTAKIKAELDAAMALRTEAEGVLASYKEKQAHYLQEAESMLAKATADAGILRAQAEKDMTATLDGRMKAAMERIAAEEEKAIVAVRARVVEMALANARTLIKDSAANSNSSDFINTALADIEQKIR